MPANTLLYNLTLAGLSAFLPPVWLASRLSGRMGDIWPRLGLYRDLAPAKGSPRVWLQAVSVGEVGLAKQVADELFKRIPGLELTVTCATGKGLERARRELGLAARVAPFPLEAPWAVAAICRKIRPHIYASLETEIWPNLLAHLDKRGVPLLLLNGRISPRSFPRYQKVRSLIAPSLARFKVLSMISQTNADRAAALGADPGRLRVDGNAKYAGLLGKVDQGLTTVPAARLALTGDTLLVAGSVRTGEEGAVLDAFKQVLEQHPEAVLAAAPRHVERAPRWLEAAASRGLLAQAYGALTDQNPRLPETRVVVVDAMGVLFGLYGLARAAFLGASLVNLGGQNPMEPAAWGVPMCFGPSMEDFLDAKGALEEAGAGRTVTDGGGLAGEWLGVLGDPAEAHKRGEAARAVVARWSRAAGTAADLICAQL